jgi:hypothetical protein
MQSEPYKLRCYAASAVKFSNSTSLPHSVCIYALPKTLATNMAISIHSINRFIFLVGDAVCLLCDWNWIVQFSITHQTISVSGLDRP